LPRQHGDAAGKATRHSVQADDKSALHLLVLHQRAEALRVPLVSLLDRLELDRKVEVADDEVHLQPGDDSFRSAVGPDDTTT